MSASGDTEFSDTDFTVLVWVREGTWWACADAAADVLAAHPGGRARLLYVLDRHSLGVADGSQAGLFGRGVRHRDLAQVARGYAEDLLTQTRDRLAARHDGEIETTILGEDDGGRVERLVTAACGDVQVLVLGRDGDLSRLGPRSLGHHTRFILDHAPCRVLLVWPEPAPGLDSIPPPPAPGHPPPPPH